MHFSARTNWTAQPNPLSTALAVLRAEGAEISDLTVSNPTRCGFKSLDVKLLAALADAKNLDYDPDAHGLVPARQAICDYYARKKIKVEPGQVFLTANTSEAYSFVFRLLAEAGDTMLAPAPGYPLMDYLAAFNDIKLERYPLVYKNRWRSSLTKASIDLDLEPKAILAVNPSNPAGNYVAKDDLAEMVMMAKSMGIALIADEVFLDYALAPAEETFSFTSQTHALTFTLSGISKVLALPQMKISWIVISGPAAERDEAIRRMAVISDTFLSAGTPAQNALPVWFQHETAIRGEILARLKNNLKTLETEIGKVGRARLPRVEGGWYAAIEITSEKTDEEWAVELLKEDRLLAHPGYLFDFPEGNFLVISLLAPEAIFSPAAARLAQRLKNPG